MLEVQEPDNITENVEISAWNLLVTGVTQLDTPFSLPQVSQRATIGSSS
jgi:hypothetical protein